MPYATPLATALLMLVSTDPDVMVPKACQVKPIVVVMADWCGYCKAARKFMRENNIAYVEINFDKLPKAQKEKIVKAGGIPQTTVGYQPFIGFGDEEWRQAFCIRTSVRHPTEQ